MQKIYDVAVIFGGVSGENEVSVITGALTCNVLKKGGKSVLPIYVDHGGQMRADERLSDVTLFKDEGYKNFPACTFVTGGVIVFNKRRKVKVEIKVGCLLNCCHGGVYEGGGVAGAAALCGIPFASAGMFESAAFMDKYLTKLVLCGLNVKTAKYAYSTDIGGAIAAAAEVGYPVIVKPATLGSSIGIAVAHDESELKEAAEVAFILDGGVLIEEYVSPRREINCAAYFHGGKVVTSPCEEFASANELLTYDDKYSGGGRRTFPAEIEAQKAEEIREETAYVYSALNMRGIVRFDYILRNDEIILSEINTVPGSLSYYLLSSGYSAFYRVLDELIEQAGRDFARRAEKKVVTTGILNNITPNACKMK